MPATQADRINFCILGPVDVEVSGRSVQVGGLRQQKLLALLVINLNRTVSTEQLFSELWETPPESARQQIHNAIGQLRRMLGQVPDGSGIVTSSVGYRIEAPDETVDLHVFRSRMRQANQDDSAGQPQSALRWIRSALGLWRGKALLGLHSPMITGAATKLEEERLAAQETLMSISLRTGRSSSIVAELQELVTENPLRETLRGQLMVALERSGRPAEALAAYDEARKLLADELGVDPGATLRTLYRDILQGTAEADTGPTVTATRGARREPEPVAPAGGRPFLSGVRPTGRCYLPNDTGDFSGRSAELVQLLTQARTNPSTALVITAIDGMGGVGKTALAIRFAHSIAVEYPDGQYFIDLHGFTPGVEPVTSAHALDALLRDSGVAPELVPLSVDARLAMWRDRMADKRALILLDNVADVPQVRPLLAGAGGCLVLITSRRKLTSLEGAWALPVDILPRSDAVSLFTQIVGTRRAGAEPDSVVAAVELCGRLPLAIRIAAARLRDRRSWSVAHLVERLTDQAQRSQLLAAGDRDVMTVLKVSYRYLGPAHGRLFRLLSLHPGTSFDAYAAAALADVDFDDAERMLETLLDDNLLRQDVAGNYYFHDLVRDCARRLCDEVDDAGVVREALGRLFDHYLYSAHVWCDGLVGAIYETAPSVGRVPARIRTDDTKEGRLEILAAEHGNICAIISFTAENGWHRHAWQFTCVVQPYLKLRNYGGNSRQLFEEALESARADGDWRGEVACLNCMIAVCREGGSLDEAQRYLDQAMRVSRATGDTDGEIGLIIHQGSLHIENEQLTAAYEVFRTAARMCADGSDTKRQFLIANNLGVICRDIGEFEQSSSYFHQAMEIELSTRNSSDMVSLVLWNLAMTNLLCGEHHEAASRFGRVLDMSMAAKFPLGQALGLCGLATTSRMLGDLEASLLQGRQALSIARQWDLREAECDALATLGETMVARKEFEQAAQVYEQAHRYAVEYTLRRYAARALDGFAHIAWLTGDRTKAREQWARAVDEYPKNMADSDYARLHLARLDDGSTTCFRCLTAVFSDGRVGVADGRET